MLFGWYCQFVMSVIYKYIPGFSFCICCKGCYCTWSYKKRPMIIWILKGMYGLSTHFDKHWGVMDCNGLYQTDHYDLNACLHSCPRRFTLANIVCYPSSVASGWGSDWSYQSVKDTDMVTCTYVKSVWRLREKSRNVH